MLKASVNAICLYLSILLYTCTAISLFDTSEGGSDKGDLFDSTPIRGVNIGGVFLIEPFIRPSLFDQFLLTHNVTDAPIDEWTFSAALGKAEAKRQLEQHWDTFVTREHLETMAQYGINWIRIPIGYWTFNVTEEEPFVDGQIPYIERILGWAREIGLKVELDLHGAPGSQNGFDNSGRRGEPRWLLDRKNVERTLDALEKMTRLGMEWEDVVYGIQILNEPSRWKWPVDDIRRFYNEAYDMVRGITDEMYFMIHDTFLGPNEWSELTSSNWTNALMDTHLYQMFDNYMVSINESTHINMVTEMTKDIVTFDRTTRIGVVVGEFSAATHDCTKYINGFGTGSRWEGTLPGTDHPTCPFQTCTCTGDYGSDYTEFSDHYKRFLKRYIDAQLQVYDRSTAGWFYWNFRTENAPEWDYLLGVAQGWIPRYPRVAVPLADDSNSLEVANGDFGDLQQSAASRSGTNMSLMIRSFLLALVSMCIASVF
ncbi:glucan exo-1,3-beta-glucosidase [Coemansia sp. RSA 1933]|nr:glucan exo-1,3-beta-glucosidase [Coemansia sp. RSA 1933]